MKKSFSQRRADLEAKEARLREDERKAKARLKFTAGEVLVAWATSGHTQANMALQILNDFVKRPSDRSALAEFMSELTEIAASHTTPVVFEPSHQTLFQERGYGEQ
jgi:hypothetical protein